MPHETALIATLAMGFALAFVLGFLAVKVRLPPLVGYLLAGVVVGPFTPGFEADVGLAGQLAEIGVILLMFGVGLHFSINDLLAVRKIAVPGAAAQIAVATALGALVAHFWGWPWSAGLVYGLALSVASTVVLLRALEERGQISSPEGQIAIGWLVVEDLATVLALVMLPALAGSFAVDAPGGESSLRGTLSALGTTLGKVTAFAVLMYFVGRRAVPWLLERVARVGSRELFTLSILAVAIGIAVGAAGLFDVSFALGAFFAGVVISESDLSHQAGADVLPFQDAFAVLFFVSVGMLFDPAVLIEQPLHVLVTVLIVMIGKSLAAFSIVLFFRYPLRTALTISASLAQIGEFSFILAGLGVSLGLLPEEGRNLILAVAILTITLNPLVFSAIPALERYINARPRLLLALERTDLIPMVGGGADEAAYRDHAIIIGYGRVGSAIGDALTIHDIPHVVIEQDRLVVEALRRRGIHALFGDAAREGVLAHAHVEAARLLVVTTPDKYQARRIIDLARGMNSGIDIVVRTHTQREFEHLQQMGVGRAVMGERELALGMAYYSLLKLGQTDDEADGTIDMLRKESSFRAPGRPSRVG